MPKHIYLPSSSVLFEENIEEGNVNSGECTNNFRSRFPPLQQKSAPHDDIGKLDQKQVILIKKHEIEQRTLESASRSVYLLHESEKLGISCAEELDYQREVLNRTNIRLDNINPNLDNGEKHLKSVNSLCYSLKKYFFGKSDSEYFSRQNIQSIRSTKPTSGRHNKTLDELSQKIKRNNNYNNHPSTRLRNVDQQLQINPVTNSLSVNDRLITNLTEMGHSIARLKNIGESLGEEINDQNKLLDTMHGKIEEADIKIHNQRKVINKVLGK